MKYSDKFERDYKLYLDNIGEFTFCGTLNPKHQAVFQENGKTAKQVFYEIDSQGKNSPTCEPELLDKLLLCKAGLNFQIKQWAEGRADGTLPWFDVYVSENSLQKEYNFPDWVLKAVELQKIKIMLSSDKICFGGPLPFGFKEYLKQQRDEINSKDFSFENYLNPRKLEINYNQ